MSLLESLISDHLKVSSHENLLIEIKDEEPDSKEHVQVLGSATLKELSVANKLEKKQPDTENKKVEETKRKNADIQFGNWVATELISIEDEKRKKRIKKVISKLILE